MVIPFFSDIRQEIIKSLDEATEEILVAVYWFTNHDLFNKLCDKVREGKKVELIIHNDFINNRNAGLDFQAFIDIGGHFFFSDADNPMHNKFCVIDNKILINGSYNWTYFAENKNSENIPLWRRPPGLCCTVTCFKQSAVTKFIIK
jgi:phosphatidylserine/phosphatidylglycerophosphate/cardiolipin synthase-like enzyme